MTYAYGQTPEQSEEVMKFLDEAISQAEAEKCIIAKESIEWL